MLNVSSVDQLVARVRDLASSDQRTLILIDGYPKSGKTAIAQRLAAIPRAEWTPLDLFVAGDEIDVKKIRKDLIKPFRKEGKVREVVPSLGGGRLQRGRPQSDMRVLILEGMGICAIAKKLRPNELWWIDSTAEERAERSGASEGVPGATMTGVIEMMRTVEDTGLREDALKMASVLVDLSGDSAASDYITADDMADARIADPDLDEEVLGSDSAGAGAGAGASQDDGTGNVDRMLNTTASIFARDESNADTPQADDPDYLDDLDFDSAAPDVDDVPEPSISVPDLPALAIPKPSISVPDVPAPDVPKPDVDVPIVPVAALEADDPDTEVELIEFPDPLSKHLPGNGFTPVTFDVVESNGDGDAHDPDDGPVELIPFDPGFALPSESGAFDDIDNLDYDSDADPDGDDAEQGDSGDLIPGWLGDD